MKTSHTCLFTSFGEVLSFISSALICQKDPTQAVTSAHRLFTSCFSRALALQPQKAWIFFLKRAVPDNNLCSLGLPPYSSMAFVFCLAHPRFSQRYPKCEPDTMSTPGRWLTPGKREERRGLPQRRRVPQFKPETRHKHTPQWKGSKSSETGG